MIIVNKTFPVDLNIGQGWTWKKAKIVLDPRTISMIADCLFGFIQTLYGTVSTGPMLSLDQQN